MSNPGMLTGYLMPLSDTQRTKCVIVEDVLWDTLSEAQRLNLLRQFLGKAYAAGARIGTVPVLGYANLQAFRKAGFLPSQRRLNAYLTLFEGVPINRLLPAIYSDVL
jgi:hypothetical protein